jgi:hypothetical protein
MLCVKKKDFHLKTYQHLLGALLTTGFPILRIKDFFLKGHHAPAFIILRHDVDRRPENALKMAILEHSLDIHSTYYFRVTRNVFIKDIIQQITEMGHEIGYHYEVMDKAKGNIQLAERIFISELQELRSITDISTACMHGNPLSSWDNKVFWRNYSLDQFDLVGEAYLSIGGKELFYSTDTGRGWNRKLFNLKDHFPRGSIQYLPSVFSSYQLMELILAKRYQKMYLQTHPNRWSWRPFQWSRQWVEDLCLNSIKWILIQLNKKKSVYESHID